MSDIDNTVNKLNEQVNKLTKTRSTEKKLLPSGVNLRSSPYIYCLGLPILILIIVISLRPNIILYTDKNDKKRISIKKAIVLTLAISALICLMIIFYKHYNK